MVERPADNICRTLYGADLTTSMNQGSYKVRNGYPSHNCAAEWTKHRTRSHLFWGLLAGWIPYGILVVAVSNWLHSRSEIGFVVVLMPYLLALFVFANMVSVFRCPRCGSPFYAWGPRRIVHNSFATRCRNCGLQKWQCDGTVSR